MIYHNQIIVNTIAVRQFIFYHILLFSYFLSTGIINLINHLNIHSLLSLPLETSLWTYNMDVYNLNTVTQFILIELSDLLEACYPLSVAFITIYQITLLGNRVILMATVTERTLQTPMFYLLANLSLLDISATDPKMVKNRLTEDHSISFFGLL